MASLYRRFVGGCILSTALCAGGPVRAQAIPPPQNATGCSLDARNRANVPLPQISETAMPAALAGELHRGYDLTFLQHDAFEGERTLKSARTLAIAAHIDCAEGLAEFGLGQFALAIKLSEALPHLLRAEQLLNGTANPLTLAYVHAGIASTRQALGDNEAFLKAAPQIAQEFRDAGDTASAIGLESVVLNYAGGPPKPEGQAALYKQLEAIDTPNAVAIRGFVQWAWGNSLRRTGRYAEILAHMQAALADLTACDCEPSTRAAVLLTFASAAASSGSSDGATVVRYATQADDIYRKDHFDSLRPQALSLVASGYAKQRDFARALTTFADALRLAREQSKPFFIASVGLEYGAAYGDSGQPLKGLQIISETTPPHPTAGQLCLLESTRTVLESQAGLYPLARDDGDKVLSTCRDTVQPAALAVVSTHYADAQLRSGHTEDALIHAREAVALIDSQRPRVQNLDAALTEYNEHQASAYTVLIRALLQSGKPEEALLASEQNRARAFVDLASTDRPATLPAPARRGSPALPLKSEAHPFTLTASKIRASLDRQHSTLISYWIADDRLYTWVMAPGKPVIERDQPISATQLASLVRATMPGTSAVITRGAQVRTRGGESQGVARAPRKPWADLYKLLIAPIAADLPTGDGAQITIVPQGPLFELSFPALLDAQHHYLIERYAITTTPSAGVLEVTAKNEAAAAKLPSRYLVLANPERFPEVNGAALPPLPGTQAEARGISLQLSGKPLTLLEGRQAGIDTLTGALPEATVLHFATHALVSDSAPSTSFLALDSRQQGGKLTAAAIYGLHLNANLVVLSACSTGRGKISGDGVAGLSRAFFYAGAASLVTTLWDVVDEPTAKLMPKFYSGLAKGLTRSAALRDAQLSLIGDLRAHRVRVETLAGNKIALPESPAYWAAFSLSGQP